MIIFACTNGGCTHYQTAEPYVTAKGRFYLFFIIIHLQGDKHEASLIVCMCVFMYWYVSVLASVQINACGQDWKKTLALRFC